MWKQGGSRHRSLMMLEIELSAQHLVRRELRSAQEQSVRKVNYYEEKKLLAGGRRNVSSVPRLWDQEEVPMTPKPTAPSFLGFDTLIARIVDKNIVREYKKKQIIFSQGDSADAVFYILNGKIKLTLISKQGKQAVLSILEKDSFLGEHCLTGLPLRLSSATAIEPTTIVRIEKKIMVRLLHEDPEFSELFTSYMLSHSLRVEEDLVDHLFHSSERRLARILLLLAHVGKDANFEHVIPKISQDTLAEMVGTTRPRISFFMKKFKKLGFVRHNDGLTVHRSLINFILHD
jgi:CRP/FNR family cyclic AMP-dependent transcriptional regulator